jgi:hypothetical protein
MGERVQFAFFSVIFWLRLSKQVSATIQTPEPYFITWIERVQRVVDNNN